MRLLKSIGTVVLSVWLVFVTMGFTIYQHVCSETGDVQISINEPVDCKHAITNKTEKNNHCCKHLCNHINSNTPKTNKTCCDKSEMTIYVDVKKQESVFVPVLFGSVQAVLSPEVKFDLITFFKSDQLRAPPLIRDGFDILLFNQTFLI